MTTIKPFLILLGLLTLSTGCRENFPVYSGFCDQNRTEAPDCLHYTAVNTKDKVLLESRFGVTDTPECNYHVELTRYHVGDCNNPVVKSVGSDFNGYVRIEIRKGFACYYKAQSDFKSDEEAALERVLTRFKKEIF